MCMQMCMYVYVCHRMYAYFETCTLSHTQNHTGNWAENCCVTGVCLALPLTLVSPPPHPSFIFRVFRDERKQLLCTLSKSEWADEKERENVGRRRVKLREVKKCQGVDETLGVRRGGRTRRKEGRQWGTKEQVGGGTCKAKVHRGIYAKNNGIEVEVKLARERGGEKGI